MSDDARCEVCGRRGRRRRAAAAPAGWLYLEVADDEAEDRDASVVVVWACSRDCAAAAWREGPGRLVPGGGSALGGRRVWGLVRDLLDRAGRLIARGPAW